MRKEWPIYTPLNLSVPCQGREGRGARFVAQRTTAQDITIIITSSSCVASNHCLLGVHTTAWGQVWRARDVSYCVFGAAVRTGSRNLFFSVYSHVRVLPLLLLLSFAPVVSALISIRFMTPKTPFLGRERERERARERCRKRSDTDGQAA